MSRKANIRKRERQHERFEQRKLEADRPIRMPRMGITAEIIADIERRKLSNIIAEAEREGD